MTITLRANSAAVTSLMTEQRTARAFTISGFSSGTHLSNDSTFRDPPSGFLDGGIGFRGRLDPVALTYTPPQLSPQTYWSQTGEPGSVVEIVWSSSEPLVRTNRYFEATFPDTPRGWQVARILQAAGWTVAGSLQDVNTPAPDNRHLQS